MTWQISLAMRGDLQKFLDAELRAGKSAVTTVIRRRTTAMKNNLRRQLRGAGMKDKLGKTIRGDTYPRRGTSFNAAGRVFSKAIYKRPGGPVDLLQVLDQGTTIRGSKWLAIPNTAVTGVDTGTRGHPKSKTIANFLGFSGKKNLATFAANRANGRYLSAFGQSLRFVPLHGGKSAALMIGDQVAYWLVRNVRQKKRIDIGATYAKAIAGLDTAIVAHWNRNDARTQTRFGVDAN